MSEEERSQSIVNNVKKLIKCLSGAESIDARIRTKLEQRALRSIRNHNLLKTNSHEVRRTVDNMVDRLEFEGLKDFAVVVKNLSIKIFDHPHWKGQYEMDAQYAMVDFLFAMTYQPIQNLRNNRKQMRRRLMEINDAMDASSDVIELSSSVNMKPTSSEENIDWVALLSEDFIPVSSRCSDSDTDSDSSLSDWSETSETIEYSHSEFEMEIKTSLKSLDMATEYSKSMTYPRGTNTFVTESVSNVAGGSRSRRKPDFCITLPTTLSFNGICCPRKKWCTLPELPPLEPPKPPTPYTHCEFDPDNLLKTTHSHWWRDDIQIYTQTPTNDPCSNFAIAYVQYLNRVGRGLIKHPLPKTISETSLVREVILMFISPASCGFFEVETIQTAHSERKQISVRHNVSIPKASSPTLFNFLEVEILPAMQAMQRLREFINEQMPQFGEKSYPGTLQNFAIGVRDLIQPIVQRIIDFERRILKKTIANSKEEDHKSRTTLISFVGYMREHFKKLLMLHSLATKAVIDAPPYLRSAYLLSQLYKQTTNDSADRKLGTALLLVSLRTYCNIIDNWWRHSELNDSEQEYIVGRSVDGSVPIARLPLEESTDLCLPSDCHEFGRELRRCKFYQMLVNHGLEAGETQHLLSSVNLLDDLMKAYRDLLPLYDELVKHFFDELQQYKRNDEAHSNMLSSEEATKYDTLREYDAKVLETTSCMGNVDIMGILTMHITQPQEQERQRAKMETSTSSEIIDVLAKLDKCIDLLPPCMLSRALEKALHLRCQVANKYVINWFHENLQLTEHVRFLRHIMLMEADYVLHPFYTSLFERIETGQRWANSALLTMDLYEKLDPHYPSKACLVYIRLSSTMGPKSTKVYVALDDLEMDYEMSLPMQRIINEQHMRQYNIIWRFILKVKWAAWKLENMRFIERTCKDAFAPLDLLGLTLRRLEMLRFWLCYVVNNLHSHLCTHVVQTLGSEFEEQIKRANRIRDLADTHNDYINKIFNHCLLIDDFDDFRKAVDQVFHLVYVLDMEWNSCCSYLNESHALSPDMSLETDGDSSLQSEALGRQKALEYLALNDIVEIEHTYIRCHHMLASLLTTLVYKRGHKFLNSLEVAINSSMPY